MRRLFLFGDSFTVDYDTDWTWTRQLAEKLHVDGLINHSMIGTSNDWILMKLRENLKDITNRDTVIIVLTSVYRYWFFKDKPELSNYMIGNWDNFANQTDDKSVVDAVKGYVNHIQRDDLDAFRFEHQVAWIKGTQQRYGFNLLLIPGFTMPIDYSGMIQVVGDLTGTVSNAEFVSKKDDEEWYSSGIDTRYNHMLKRNHDIMAAKCANSLLTKQPLDLQVGFERHILKGNERLTHKELGPKLIETSNELYGDKPKPSAFQHWLKN